eukprot:CAMPEP_0196574338 /NCGR_PEP_ID=MMETSP1081-20130531/4071_1 /TAXON_ID=36882 /ORGANISM="Pyramimonas amylifera, Strain CCMP720" /LENGTH=280 /DNA_ID=CAMNT_0041892331 /DNA_START=623 /DNA_END=1465 /DNA_ORIENTATION=+
MCQSTMYGGGCSEEEGLNQARVYDLATSTSRYFPEEVDFFLNVAGNFLDKPVVSTLELAAGPARHSIELAKRGVEALALDSELAMVQLGLLNAEEAGVQIKYLQKDMRRFDEVPSQAGQVQLVLLLFGSAEYLVTNDDFVSCLQSCKEVLEPGSGLVLVELQHPEVTFSVVTSDWGQAWEAVDEKTGNRVLVEWGREGDEFNSLTQVVQKRTSFNVFDKKNELLNSHESIMPQRLYTCTELDALVRLSGFTICKLYGDMDMNMELSEESDRMVAVLKPNY